jgi:hypothetical protein
LIAGKSKMNEVQQAAAKYHRQHRLATKQHAEQAADIEFAEGSDQRECVAFWQKLHDQEAAIQQAQFRSDVDRIWPEDKYD